MSAQTMQAQVLHAVGDMRFEAIARPTPGPGEVLVRVVACGVCGSDIPRTFVKGTYHFPTIIGHEFAGQVEEVGEGVEGFRSGDAVAVFPLIWCGRCSACEQGRYAQCLDYDYLGSRSDGAFAEFVVAPARNLLPVPDGVSLDIAAMTEPAAVALHAVRRAGSAVGQTVAIFGAGPIGLMAAQWARIMGAGQVIVFDIVPEKLELARTLGFETAFNNFEVDPVKKLEALTSGEGAEVTVEAAGVPQTFRQAVAATRRAGRMIILGNPASDVILPVPLISQAMRREIDLLGVWNSDYSAAGNDDDWRTVLCAMASGALQLEPLITHRLPLAEAFSGLNMMKEGQTFYAKVLIQPNTQ
ncbi:MAG: galactitol-1-phosphate 5-dehydrogenase [Caldilineales bacterium]|nr:galactitol-1-phosphate 5-dehydrogenase [Caldilineales bacterium]